MPDLYGPFDNSSWSQTQWYRYAPTWAPSGVVGSAAAATTASAGPLGLTFSGLNLTLSLGRAWVYGAGYERTSTPWTGTVPVNTSSNPRIDALVLRRDLAAKTVLPTILQGTPAASPVAPTRSSDELGQWDLPLFTWTTPGNSGSPINTVTDNRVWVDTQGTNYAVFSSGAALPAQIVASTTTKALAVGSQAAADVGLNLSNVAAGTYLVDAFLSSGLGSGSTLYWRLMRDTTAVTASLVALSGISGSASATAANVGPFVSTGSNGGFVLIRGHLILTAPKLVALDVASSAATNLFSGSLTLTKVA